MKLGKFMLSLLVGAISAFLLSTALSSSAFALTVRVAPGGTGSEGATWEDALGDLATAIDKVSAAGGGEVWVKAGAYYIASTLPLKSGVAVIGGFTGGEASAAEANGKANVTLLYGDAKLDSYWKPNGVNKNYSETYRVLVDEGDGKVSVNAINPGFADHYWKYNGNVNDDTQTCFRDAAGGVTDCALRGLTIATFSYTSVEIAAGSEVSISACDFVADNQGLDAQQPILCAGFLDLKDCSFRGCRYGVQFTAASDVEGKMNLVAGCLFEGCAGSGNNACVYNLSNKSLTIVSNCVFRCNFGDGNSCIPCVNMQSGLANGSVLANCVFSNNYLTGGAEALVTSAKPVERCRFIGNAFESEAASGGTRHSACLSMSGNYLVCRDCYFAGNTCSGARAAGNAKDHLWSSVFGLSSGIVAFLNCTFVGNTAYSSGTDGNRVGTVVIQANDINQSVSFYDCLFKDNAADGGLSHGEIVIAPGNGYSGGNSGSPFSFVNCVFENAAADYVPWSAKAEVTPCYANCNVCNLDLETVPQDEKSFLVGVTTERTAGVASRPQCGANGAWALGVTARSPFRKGGRPVWTQAKDKTGGVTICCYLPEADPANPWRGSNSKGGFNAAGGLTPESPSEPDALGQAWSRNKIAYGPVRPESEGLILLLR